MIKLRNKVLSIILAVTMMVSLVVPVMGADWEDDFDMPEEFSALEVINIALRMAKVSMDLKDAAETYGEIDFGNGYVVDLGAEMLAYAAKIDHDLGIAAGLASGQYNHPNLLGVPANISNTSRGYTQPNFNTAINRHSPAAGIGAATTYLTKGGFAEGQNALTSITWFFAYKSQLNPNYNATIAATSILGGVTRQNELPAGRTLADVAVDYFNSINDVIETANQLNKDINTINSYIEAAKELLKDYYDHIEGSCELEDDCDELACNLLVDDPDEWINAVNRFITGLEHDIKVIGALATGNITDSNLWTGNRDGASYYASKNPILSDKLEAAKLFLSNGGYNIGEIGGLFSGYAIEKQLYYKSGITDYNVGTSFENFTITGETAIIPFAEMVYTTLAMGTTADNLDMIFDMYINDINSLIEKISELPLYVPAGGTYTQEEYESAKAAFIDNANRDLAIAMALASGDFSNVIGYNDKWTSLVSTPQAIYNNGYTLGIKLLTGPGETNKQRLSNAVQFYINGGYEYGFDLFNIGIAIKFKSSFHQDFSSGLFGIAANKTNVINLMRLTVDALEKGNPYWTPLQIARHEYEKMLADIQAIIREPAELIEAVINSGDDDSLALLLADLNILVGSLDDIVNILELVGSNALVKSLLEPVLEQMGLSYEMLEQLAGLRDMLGAVGLDTSGEMTIEETLVAFIENSDIFSSVLSGGLELALIGPAQLAALPGTESAYKTATAMLQGSHDLITESAAEAINMALSPIVSIIEPFRPYMTMLTSGIALINGTLELLDSLTSLAGDTLNGNFEEFFLNSSGATYALADILDNLGYFLEALDDALFGENAIFGLGDAILNLINNGMLNDIAGDAAAGGLALLLNGASTAISSAINSWLGTGLDFGTGLTGDDLGVVVDPINSLVNSLLNFGLNNLTAIVPLLHASADSLRVGGDILEGMQRIIDSFNAGAYSDILSILLSGIQGVPNAVNVTIDWWVALFGLFTGGTTPAENAVMQQAFSPDLMDEAETEIFQAFGMAMMTGLTFEIEETLQVMTSPNTHVLNKYAKYNAFCGSVKNMLAGMNAAAECMLALRTFKAELIQNKICDIVDAKVIMIKTIRDCNAKLIACIQDCITNKKDMAASIKAFYCEMIEDMMKQFLCSKVELIAGKICDIKIDAKDSIECIIDKILDACDKISDAKEKVNDIKDCIENLASYKEIVKGMLCLSFTEHTKHLRDKICDLIDKIIDCLKKKCDDNTGGGGDITEPGDGNCPDCGENPCVCPAYYTVTFDLVTGSDAYNYTGTLVQTVAEGGDATAPTDVVRKGYVFFDWIGDFTDVKSDITITADWVLLGDVDQNGRVTSNDANMVMQIAIGLIDENSLTEKQRIAANVYNPDPDDPNDSITSNDANMVMRYVVELIQIWPHLSQTQFS